jgi:hypothetical protein
MRTMPQTVCQSSGTSTTVMVSAVLASLLCAVTELCQAPAPS